MTHNEIDPNNDIYDLVEEYYKGKEEVSELNEDEDEYFSLESSKPPHYWAIVYWVDAFHMKPRISPIKINGRSIFRIPTIIKTPIANTPKIIHFGKCLMAFSPAELVEGNTSGSIAIFIMQITSI